jgi:acetyl esterase/lipase
MKGYLAALTMLFLTGSAIGQDSTKVIRNLEYAKVGDVRLALDLHLPTKGAGPFPVIVAIHGGGWAAGKREEAQGIRQASRLCRGRN